MVHEREAEVPLSGSPRPCRICHGHLSVCVWCIWDQAAPDRFAVLQVWDHSWKYTDDRQPCMQLWFEPGQGNPNDLVARLRAQELAGGGGSGGGRAVSHPLLAVLGALLLPVMQN